MRANRSQTMNLTINGEVRDAGAVETLGDLITRLDIRREGTAIAVNDAVIPKSALVDYRLADGDAVEIITAVAGG